jgi:hypothetical protein
MSTDFPAEPRAELSDQEVFESLLEEAEIAASEVDAGMSERERDAFIVKFIHERL